MARDLVKLVVTVEVPEGFSPDKVDLPKILSKFVKAGLADLIKTVEDEKVESSTDEEFVAWRTKWGKTDYLYGVGQ